MKKIKVGLRYKKKKIYIKDVKKVSLIGKGIGLMFRSREKCPAMLFEFSNPTRMRIHSLFVFFPFAAVWLDEKNKIIELKRINPFQLIISCKSPFYKLLEIPINKKYQKEIKLLLGK